MKMRKSFILFLSIAIAAVIAAPWNVMAKETSQEVMEWVPDTERITDIFEDLPENDELFEGYVNELFFDSYSMSTFGNYGENRLEGIDLAAYNYLKEKLGKIASGEIADTKITVSLKDLGITETEWTVRGETINDAAAVLYEKIMPSLHNIFRYLLVDCPYELYWFDKNNGGVLSSGWGLSGYSLNRTDWVLSVTKDLEYTFVVAKEYQDNSAQDPKAKVNQSLVQSAKKALDNVKAIVKKYEGYSDHDKLSNYKKEICKLVSYNHSAADDSTKTPYGNPWQLIWVFDGDPETNVVCEGYSKAFQYLCDLSDFFSPNISCYTVTGMMGGGTGAGPHMWNIVTMDDQKNYIVDVTNCDSSDGSDESDNRLFLVGANGSVESGYEVGVEYGNYTQKITYVYSGNKENDMDMSEMYGKILEISESNYEFPYVHSGGFGSDLEWTLDANGILNIKGSGDMPEPEDEVDYTVIPWHDYREEVKRVVIEEGITSVASWAFLQFENITEIYLPEGLKSIQNASFALSRIKNLELPKTLETIGMLAFANCSDLMELEIPSSVKSVGAGAFMDCGKLESISINSDNPYFSFEDGILYNKDKTVVHLCLGGRKGEVEIAEGVTEIEMYAFNGCRGITDIVVPAGVLKVGTEAFEGCGSLKNVWFLGECPVFQEMTDKTGSVFKGNDLILHYPEVCESSWETVKNEFPDAQVAFRSICREGQHQWQEDYTIDQEATCTKDGMKSKGCELCGRIKERDIIPAGHSWEEAYTVEKEPSCIEEGLESVHCKNCEEVKDRRVMPFAAHHLIKTNQGVVQYYICLICKKTFQDAEGLTEFAVSDINHTENDDQPEPEQNVIKATRISITSDASNQIAAGKKVTLKAAVFPNDVTNSAVKWESINKKYATVSAKGVVTTKKAGKGQSVTITATAADGSGVKASYKIKLMGNAVTRVKITNAKKTLKSGKTMKLKVSVSTNGKKANKKIQWTSSNTKYATVNSKGVVKAKKNVKNKTVTITAMSTDGTKKKHNVKIKIV